MRHWYEVIVPGYKEPDYPRPVYPPGREPGMDLRRYTLDQYLEGVRGIMPLLPDPLDPFSSLDTGLARAILSKIEGEGVS